MLVHIPDHFSSKLNFDIPKGATVVVDRASLFKSFLGFCCGILLLFLGIFEMFTFLKSDNKEQSYFMVEIFALIIILLALYMIFYYILSFMRYKEISFDGKSFKIAYHPTIGIKYVLDEPIENYIGVRFRMIFASSAIFNKNRYIIDLYHREQNKIIPLYITSNKNNIRNIWENYSRFFKLPALSIGERGLVQRDYTDLNKTVKILAREGKLQPLIYSKVPTPKIYNIENFHKVCTVTSKGLFLDTFSFLFLLVAFSVAMVLVLGGVYLTVLDTVLPLRYWFWGGVAVISILYFAIRLFKTFRLNFDGKNINIQEILSGMVTKEENIAYDVIKNIELVYNPMSDRYSLAIISDNILINFGHKLPVEDLLWLRDFILCKIIGN